MSNLRVGGVRRLLPVYRWSRVDPYTGCKWVSAKKGLKRWIMDPEILANQPVGGFVDFITIGYASGARETRFIMIA